MHEAERLLQEMTDAVALLNRPIVTSYGCADSIEYQGEVDTERAHRQQHLVECVERSNAYLEGWRDSRRPLKWAGPDGGLQTPKHPGDVGYDLVVQAGQRIKGGEFVDLSTGVYVELPPGTWGRIVGRSSTLRRLRLLVGEGVIDNGYRGELYVGVWNLHVDPIVVDPGTRVAQLILQRVETRPTERVAEISADSARGASGFGSTGV